MARPLCPDTSADAGFVFQSQRTGATVYDAAQQEADTDGGKYVIICTHGRLVNTNNKQTAKWVAGNPHDLCPACRKYDFDKRDLTPSEDQE